MPAECPHCSLAYREFRVGLRFADTRDELMGEVRAQKRRHITRHTVLGRMHEHKRNYWDEHLRLCAEETPF